MATVFLLVLILTMAFALASGYPVAFALPGSAILSIGLAALFGWIFAGNVDAYFVHGGPGQWLDAGVTNFRGVYWEVERDTLIAIPLFVFMGIMLERSKVAEDLLVTMAQLFGPIPGGLGIAVVFVGALLAATTGIVGATVIAMGLISLPVMLRANYSKSLATGTISASGTLGQIIPPSIVLIILADQLASATDQALTIRTSEFKQATGQFSMPTEFGLTSTSAGDMFLGSLLPGFVLVGLYMAFILIVALIRPRAAPPVPFEGRMDRAFIINVALALIPPLALIFVVLGSIIMGVATVNQAGAIGAIGATVMAGYRLKENGKRAYVPGAIALAGVVVVVAVLSNTDLNIKSIRTTADVTALAIATFGVVLLLAGVLWSMVRTYRIGGTLQNVMVETAKTTSLVFIILLGAAMLTAAFRAFGGEDLVREFLASLPGGFITKFVVVMAVIFILGFFLDFIEIAVVVVPIISPILLADTSANITAVWLGVMIGVNMQTSFLTPPFGFALFYLRGVAPPSVTTVQMYAGVVPFILLQLTGLAIVGMWPALVNYLPNRVYLTAETAPPPKNPRLQACIEKYLFERYDNEGAGLRQAIATARGLDLSILPAPERRKLTEGFKAAEQTFANVAKVRETADAVEKAAPAYRPVHHGVRRIQAELRAIGAVIQDNEETIRRLQRGDGNFEERIASLRAQIEAQKAAQRRLQERIPANWEELRKNFVALADAETRARRDYRRGVDSSYEALAEIIKLLNQTSALAAIRGRLEALVPVVAQQPFDRAAEAVREAERLFNDLTGTSDIRSRLSRARRSLTRNDPDRERALKDLEEGLKRHADEVAWRERASKEMVTGLTAYERAIRNSIGLRSQARLTGDQADDIASCLSVHRDISLNF